MLLRSSRSNDHPFPKPYNIPRLICLFDICLLGRGMNRIYRFVAGFILLLTHDCWSWAQEPWAIATGQSVVEVRAGLRHIYQRLGRKDLVAALDSAAVTN